MPSRRAPLERGDRVLLHAPAARDRDDFVALVRASRALHRGWVTPPDDAAGFTAYCRRVRGDRYAGFLLRRREDDALVGMVNVNEIVRGAFQSGYLGYWVGRPYAGQGYMTEGLTLAIRHAFGKLGLHRLEANIQPGNEPSRRLVERLGFRNEGRSERYLKIRGRWRDHDRFALVAEEWQRPRRRR